MKLETENGELKTEKQIEAPYELPEGWKWVKVGEVAEIINGKNQKEVEDENGIYPIYGSGGIIGRATDFICPENCTIIGRKGTINNPIFVETKFWNVDTAFGMKTFDCVTPKFYFYFCKSFNFLTLDSSTAIPSLTKSNIQQIPFPLPPTLAEQQRIVNRIESMFAKLDEAKEKAQNVVDGFETRKSAILHKAFTGELTAKWRKENGVSDESWLPAKMESLSDLITKGASPKWQGIQYTSDTTQTLFVTSENVREGYLDLEKEKYLENKINEIQKRSVLQKGDVLLNIVGASIGRSAIYNLEKIANTNQAVCIIRLKKTVFNEFICYFLNSNIAKIYYDDNKVETARANISLSNVSNMVINLPTLPEQVDIVRILDIIIEKENKAKQAAEAVLEQIDLLKKSILARVFRGEL